MKYLLILLAISSFAADPASFARRRVHIRALLAQSDYVPALAEARLLNREWPDDIETYQMMATAHLELGNYQQADEALQWMLDLRIGKADVPGYWLLARFREVTGDTDGAIEAMNAAFGRLQTGEKADRSRMLAYLAHLQILSGKMILAGKILRESDGTDIETQLVQAQLFRAQAKQKDAILVLRELASKHLHPCHLYALAEASGDSADYTAFELAARKLRASPDNANRELTIYLAGPGHRPAEALEIARHASIDRRDIWTLHALSVALAASGDRDGASKVMAEVLAVGTQDPVILAQAARLGIKPQ